MTRPLAQRLREVAGIGANDWYGLGIPGLIRDAASRIEELEVERGALRAERGRLRLDKARHMARGAVLVQLCSHLARNGQQDLAKLWLARGDAAMADVRPEDLVRIAMPPKREKETP